MNQISVSQQAWDDAISTFEECGAFVRVGPRRAGCGWIADAVRVVRREVEDPLGWAASDEQPWEPPPEGKEETPLLPFGPVTETDFDRLFATSREGAEIVVREVLEERVSSSSLRQAAPSSTPQSYVARSVMNRFGEAAQYFTNHGLVKGTPPDFTRHTYSIGVIGAYMMSWGVVVVSEKEIGVFWKFEED